MTDLLQDRKCKVFDKVKGLYVKNIEVKKYGSRRHGGRVFFGDGTEIFSVVDRIS